MLTYVTGANLDKRAGNDCVFALPRNSTGSFPTLFEELDKQLAVIGVKSYGVSMASIEEVFLKVGFTPTIMSTCRSPLYHRF